jgi:hypothetical protein
LIALAALFAGSPISAPGASQEPSSPPQTKKAPETATPAAPVPDPIPAQVKDPRQAKIVADTQRLLKLSQELKDEVAKSNKDTLSLAVVKKAEEVERLAKALKEEMGKAH